MLTAQAVPAFDDNYIWLIRRPNRPQVAIVDPGDAEPVLETIRAEGLEPVAILITHHHWDHVGGIADLLALYPIPVYGPANETIPHISHSHFSHSRIVDYDTAVFKKIHFPTCGDMPTSVGVSAYLAGFYNLFSNHLINQRRFSHAGRA